MAKSPCLNHEHYGFILKLAWHTHFVGPLHLKRRLFEENCLGVLTFLEGRQASYAAVFC